MHPRKCSLLCARFSLLEIYQHQNTMYYLAEDPASLLCARFSLLEIYQHQNTMYYLAEDPAQLS